MGETGCYALMLYCDHSECLYSSLMSPPGEYTGATLGDCRRQARADGWLISRTKRSEDGEARALCPKHSGKR